MAPAELTGVGSEGMEQRVSLITLGVRDLARARAFYEALGWVTRAKPDDDVVFFQAGGLVFALWGRDQLAEDSGVEDAGGWGGVTLAHNVRSPGRGGLRRSRRPAAPARTSSASRRRRSGAATRRRSSTRRATRGRWPTTRAGRSTTTAPSSCRPTSPTAASPCTRLARDEAPVRALADTLLEHRSMASRVDVALRVAGLRVAVAEPECESAAPVRPEPDELRDRRTRLERLAVGAEGHGHKGARTPAAALEPEDGLVHRARHGRDRHAEPLAAGRLAGPLGGGRARWHHERGHERQYRDRRPHGRFSTASSITGIVRGARFRYCTQPGIDLDAALVPLGALVALELAGHHLLLGAVEQQARARVLAEVVVPGRVVALPVIRGDHDQPAVAAGDGEHGRGALGAALRARGGEPRHRQACQPGRERGPAAGELEDRPVDQVQRPRVERATAASSPQSGESSASGRSRRRGCTWGDYPSDPTPTL